MEEWALNMVVYAMLEIEILKNVATANDDIYGWIIEMGS